MTTAQLASVRAKVRSVLHGLPKGQGATVDFVTHEIHLTTPLRPSRAEVESALIWNQSNGWCDFALNKEIGWDEWTLTTAGLKKEKEASALK
jgi:hypothetical protein